MTPAERWRATRAIRRIDWWCRLRGHHWVDYDERQGWYRTTCRRCEGILDTPLAPWDEMGWFVDGNRAEPGWDVLPIKRDEP